MRARWGIGMKGVGGRTGCWARKPKSESAVEKADLTAGLSRGTPEDLRASTTCFEASPARGLAAVKASEMAWEPILMPWSTTGAAASSVFLTTGSASFTTAYSAGEGGEEGAGAGNERERSREFSVEEG